MLFATLVAITSVFGLGVSFAILGSVKIRLTQNIGIDDAQMGKLFSVFNASNLVFVLVAGVLCDVWGFKAVAIIGYVVGALAIFLFGQSKSFGAAAFGCLLLGVGAMFMNSVGNTLLGNPQILYEDPGRSGNLGNVFFGVGAFIVPMLTAWLFRKTTYGNALTTLAVIVFIPVIFALIGEFPEAPAGFSLAQAAALAGQSQIILCALALMCYIALEVSMGGWITTYMTGVGADEAKASSVLSAFWISIMIGRLLTALWISNYISLDSNFIMGLAIVAALVLFYLTKANSVGAATICMILLGLVFAPIFPTIVGIMFARTDPSLQGTGFGLIFAVGLIGAIFVPAWIGSISKGKTIKASMGVAAGTALILVVMAILMGLLLPAPLATSAAVPPAPGIEQGTTDTAPAGDVAAPETAAPETAVPETAAPETVAPETVAPETVAPETVAPETVAPETVAPETVAPATP